MAEIRTKDSDILYVLDGMTTLIICGRTGWMRVDYQGSLYVSGPCGLWNLSAEGRHLRTVVAPKHLHNLAGDENGRTL